MGRSFVPVFIKRFKTKAQQEEWYRKWDVIEYEDDEDISEYATKFKKIYKRVDSSRKIPKWTIVRKFINSLPLKYTEMLTIIRPNTLEEAIEGALDVKASQKIKGWRKKQSYLLDTIKALKKKVHALQIKATTLAEPVQGIQDEIFGNRGRGRVRGRGKGYRERGNSRGEFT